MSNIRLRHCLIIATIGVAGCSVGPDYVAPDQASTAAWQRAVESQSGVAANWWADGGHPTIAGLVNRAVRDNKDIDIAKARLSEAEAGQVSARGTRLPALAADARYTAFEQSIESPQAAGPLIDAGIIPREGEFYTGTLQASWELDLFGLRGRQIAAADARAMAISAEVHATVLQIVAETVSAYADWHSFSERVVVAERNAALQQQTLNIIDNKVRLGLSRKLDSLRASTALNELQSRIPVLQASAVSAYERLAVLLGTTSDKLGLTLQSDALKTPASIAVGTKSALLQRRPDVIVAERLLAAATEEQGAATAAMFPQLTLTASGGFEAANLSNLASGDARTTGIVPFVRWPIFQGNRLRAARAAADARQQQAMAAYEKAVLTAFADTESAIAAQRAAVQSLGFIEHAASAAAAAEVLASRLYQQGLSDYLTLLDAQRQLALIEDARIVAQNQVMLNAMRLYKSLGGAWPRDVELY